MECQRKPAAVWHQPRSSVFSARTKSEPSLREFRDPNGRLFRLNLKTGATEWEDEKSQRSGEPGHAELEDWLGGSDPAAEEVRQDLALDLGMRPASAPRESRSGQASAALKSLRAKVETKPSKQKMLESQAFMSLMDGSDIVCACVCAILFMALAMHRPVLSSSQVHVEKHITRQVTTSWGLFLDSQPKC
jgi:hypothetical protein